MLRRARGLLTSVFARPFTGRRQQTLPHASLGFRTRLDVNQLEDRLNPMAVAMTVVNQPIAPEDGTHGEIQVSRTGSTSNAVTVNYTISGTATNGVDYTTLSGSVVIGVAQSSAIVDIEGLHDGHIEDDEDVTLTLASGSGYTINETSNTGTVTVVDTDLDPMAFDDLATTSINEAVTVAVLDFTTDLNDDTLSVTAVTQGGNGSVSINQNGTVTYTPETAFVGDDSFTYTVEDQFGNEATGTVTVTVTQPEAPPTSVWTATNTAVTVAVLDMAFDPDGQTLTTTSVTQGLHGGVVLNQNGTVTYTPDTSFTGDDSFAYTVEDPDGNEATDTITVTVGGVDPIALDDDVATAVNTAKTITASDIAFDPAGDTLTVTAVTQGAHGTVVNNQNGTFTYTPNTSYSGTDSFTYTVKDNDNHTSVGTIHVTIGTPAPSDVDGILSDLDDIQNEIENYDEDTPSELANALPGITSAVSSYITAEASFFAANSPDAPGLNHSYKDFTTKELGVLDTIYAKYGEAINLEAKLWDTSLGIRDLIVTLRLAMRSAENAANPDQTLIAALHSARNKFGRNLSSIFGWVLFPGQTVDGYRVWKRLGYE